MKPVFCSQEMGTERPLCPGTGPQGPSQYHGDISKLSTILQDTALFGFFMSIEN